MEHSARAESFFCVRVDENAKVAMMKPLRGIKSELVGLTAIGCVTNPEELRAGGEKLRNQRPQPTAVLSRPWHSSIYLGLVWFAGR